tara:strand:+ start:20518 stop:21030 length:513 start_codon:yes stop_codon:yes gene_type:complete
MNLQEIEKAVLNGRTVNWKNANYKVIHDPKTGFLIKSENNENYIGLTWQDGKTMNGEEKDFYLKEEADNLQLIAVTRNGMAVERRTEINSISVWINKYGQRPQCTHKPSKESIGALLADAIKSGRIVAYTSGESEGNIDAFEGTPLYTNGQENVKQLIFNGKIIWGETHQ